MPTANSARDCRCSTASTRSGRRPGRAIAGFVLLPELGVSATQSVAVVANLVIGILAIGIDLASGRDASADEVVVVETDDTWESPSRGSLPLRLAFIGTGIAGFSALGLEVHVDPGHQHDHPGARPTALRSCSAPSWSGSGWEVGFTPRFRCARSTRAFSSGWS